MPKEAQPPPKAENETAFQRFHRLAKRIVTVPKPRTDKPKGDGNTVS